jgi:hypothetical protein
VSATDLQAREQRSGVVPKVVQGGDRLNRIQWAGLANKLLLPFLWIFWVTRWFGRGLLQFATKFTLVIIGGALGLVAWLLWGGAILGGQYYAGGMTAFAAGAIVGKLVTPLWLWGMHRQAARHWPWFRTFHERLKESMKMYLACYVAALFWLVFFGVLLWKGLR